MASDLRPRWKGLPPGFRRSLLISLAIALAIEGLLHLVHHHPRMVGARDQAMDWMIGIYRNVQPRRADPVPFTLLDIDDLTFRRWGEPLFVPREKLAHLIATVVDSGPRLVVVDVGLTTASGTTGDDELRLLLSRWASAPGGPGNPPGATTDLPPLILLAAFRSSLLAAPGDDATGRHHEPTAKDLPERRSSFLDREIDGAEGIVRASPLFVRGTDWVIRRWKLWQPACAEDDGRLEVLPSIQLLVAALLAAPELSPRLVAERLEETVSAAGAFACDATPHAADAVGDGPRPTALPLGDRRLSLAASELNQRIVFRYPAPDALRRDESYPRQPTTGVPLLSVVPAYPITDGKAVDSTLFRDRIVVIGGSFSDGRDFHRTPLGVMPGTLVIVNAIDSLLEFGQLRPLDWPARYAITIGLVLVMSLVFTFFHTLKGALVAFVVLLVTLLPLSVIVFKAGYWVDFAVPLVAVYLHRRAGEIERLFHRSGTPADNDS